MYHSIGGQGNGEAGSGLYCVPAERFRGQMEYLVKVARAGERQVAITFDDGLLDNYTNAYPILKEFGLKAYFFILVAKAGTEGYMGWEQIKELSGAGMTIGSHGMTHRILTELDGKDLEYELKDSKKILEDNLGKAIDFLSIPRGFCNKKVIDKAKGAGYKRVFTSNQKDNDGFRAGRIPVKGDWDLRYFISVLNNGLSIKDKAESIIIKSSKKVLGAKYYDRIRTKLLKK